MYIYSEKVTYTGPGVVFLELPPCFRVVQCSIKEAKEGESTWQCGLLQRLGTPLALKVLPRRSLILALGGSIFIYFFLHHLISTTCLKTSLSSPSLLLHIHGKDKNEKELHYRKKKKKQALNQQHYCFLLLPLIIRHYYLSGALQFLGGFIIPKFSMDYFLWIYILQPYFMR